MAQSLILSATTTSEATSRDTVLAVENMDCGACIFPVEAALRGVPGVETVRANLSLRRVRVKYDPLIAGGDLFIRALDKAGFVAAELTGTEQALQHSDLLPRLGVAAFAAMNIMLLSVSVWSGAGADMDVSTQALFHRLSALIAIPAVAYAGVPFFTSAIKALSSRRLNMDVPISLGVVLATAMSIFQTIRGNDQVYFDAAVTLLAFLLAGRLLDRHMRQRAESAVGNLLGLKVASAFILNIDGSQARLPVRDLRPGMSLLSSAGERIAADGVIRAGSSEIDESLITGEGAPRSAKPGDLVYAGTINLGDALTIEVTSADDQSLLSQIIAMMSVAEQSKGRYIRLADRAARIYAPLVHVLALSTFLLWLGFEFAWDQALTAAISVLIVTCPCALALAVPAVQVAASSRLFAAGILLKRADGLERLAEVTHVVFDKTGTLTDPDPVIADIELFAAPILARAASLALSSRHPYARALVAAARSRNLTLRQVPHVVERPGLGLECKSSPFSERLGSAVFTGSMSGSSGLYYRDPNGGITVFTLREQLRRDAAAVVKALLAQGYKVELLSGDTDIAAGQAASSAGITRWQARATPKTKLGRLDELAAQGELVLMVGDGLNDSPALAAAHASLAPSSGIDVSQLAADAVFQGKKLQAVLDSLTIAKLAHRLALENFAIAIAYNLLFVPLAMLGLVTPLIAAVAMSLSSISVTANALRLQKVRLGELL
ncbi:MAG: heavy metal translocating P-type ATPase [Hyphomicrobiaceae bacterium]|nr:heavy metal translocating P-type ATPase [Hyphomicrobiaceae bacterium]